MEEVSTEPFVPAVKRELKSSSFIAMLDSGDIGDGGERASAGAGAKSGFEVHEVDKDLLCPICMQTIKDAFLTGCGHSFCYMCIITHLRNKSDCPCCGHYLTNNQLYPNFLLDKLIVIEFLCTTFVAFEEDFCLPSIKIIIPWGTILSRITTGLRHVN